MAVSFYPCGCILTLLAVIITGLLRPLHYSSPRRQASQCASLDHQLLELLSVRFWGLVHIRPIQLRLVLLLPLHPTVLQRKAQQANSSKVYNITGTDKSTTFRGNSGYFAPFLHQNSFARITLSRPHCDHYRSFADWSSSSVWAFV